MIAIGYARVSTEDQANHGVSLDLQTTRIEAFALAKGWELRLMIRDEGKSGKNLHRPGIKKIIALANSKSFDVVITLKLDRLTRSIKDLGFLIDDVFNKNGLAFSSIEDNFDTSTANGRLVMNVLGSVAQWEREAISERTRAAIQYKKSAGQVYGVIPMGYTASIGGDLVPDPEELQIIERAQFLRKEGYSYAKIAALFNLENVKTKKGGNWFGSTVNYLVNNLLYAERRC